MSTKNKLLNGTNLTPLPRDPSHVDIEYLYHVLSILKRKGAVAATLVMSKGCYENLKTEANAVNDDDLEYEDFAGIPVIVDDHLPGNIYQFRAKDGGILTTNMMG